MHDDKDTLIELYSEVKEGVLWRKKIKTTLKQIKQARLLNVGQSKGFHCNYWPEALKSSQHWSLIQDNCHVFTAFIELLKHKPDIHTKNIKTNSHHRITATSSDKWLYMTPQYDTTGGVQETAVSDTPLPKRTLETFRPVPTGTTTVYFFTFN